MPKTKVISLRISIDDYYSFVEQALAMKIPVSVWAYQALKESEKELPKRKRGRPLGKKNEQPLKKDAQPRTYIKRPLPLDKNPDFIAIPKMKYIPPPKGIKKLLKFLKIIR